MLRNYLKTAWHNLKKNKKYTIINIFGLTLAITCAPIIFLIVRFQFSFDKYQPYAKRTYRVVINFSRYGNHEHLSGVPYPLPKAFQNRFASQIKYLTIVDARKSPDIVSVKRLDGKMSRFSFRKRNKSVGAAVNSNYFKIFSYQWISGNPDKALHQPNSVVLTQSLATLFFGSKNPMGRTLTIDNSQTVKVTGVVKDPPPNTDMPFNLFLRSTLSKKEKSAWHHNFSHVQCYFVLREGGSALTINRGLHQFENKHFQHDPEAFQLQLQPLTNLHFNQQYENFNYHEASKNSLWVLVFIGLVILLIACINFTNLNTAIAANRAKEVDVRKVLGSSRMQLIVHFLLESGIIILISMLISVALVRVAMAHLHLMAGYNLHWNYFNVATPVWYLLAIGAFAALVATLYPALKLSGYSPVRAIHNTVNAGYSRGLSFRKGLVVLQLVISQVLIIAVLVNWGQLHFMNNKDMGLDAQNVIQVPLPSNRRSKLQAMRSGLLEHPEIKNVSFSNTGAVSNNTSSFNVSFVGDSVKKKAHVQVKFIDKHYVNTYGLTLLAGRVPHHAMSDSLSRLLANQAFIKKFGLDKKYRSDIGKIFNLGGLNVPIVGVVKNFNTQSLLHKIKPVIMVIYDRYRRAAIKIDGRHTQQAIKNIKKEWTAAFPKHVFSYSFLNKKIAEFYTQNRQTANMITFFTLIAILIDCLGLFGLISYMTVSRTKEVGIRKVLGAPIGSILWGFLKEILILTGIGFIAAIPIAWYLMSRWLSNFAYKMHFGVSIFIIALIISLFIALATVSWQSIRAALANPVDSLRSE